MKTLWKKEPIILLLGDLSFFVISLWISLFLRNFSIPSKELFYLHLAPFSIIFVVSVLVFYIAGLYGKHVEILRSRLPENIFNTQFANSLVAVAFFYLIPVFGITPKTLLFIYLGVSSLAILFWRVYLYFLIVNRKIENAIVIGSGDEVRGLLDEVGKNSIYNIRFVSSIDLNRLEDEGFGDEIVAKVYEENVSIIAIDLSNDKVEPILPRLYNLIFSKVTFVDMHKIYQDIFDKVPLSLLKYNWFLENVSSQPRAVYDALKRFMDITLSLILGIISLVFYPFVILAIKIEDGGPIFISQERVGKGNKALRIYKFRSMRRNDHGDYKSNQSESNEVTRVGAFLRKSRIDELPQLWNVLTGDISLIGPRPELPSLTRVYEKEIPFYNVRHIIKPGLSGWAQIHQENHPHHKEAVSETKEKLTYDLYYIKERSFLLDLKIALKTIKTLLSRVGV